MKAHEYGRLVGEEVLSVLADTDDQQIETLLDMVEAADHIFVGGAGRSLLMLSAFAMRLMHIGMDSYVVGETTTPAIVPGDVLVAASGSGQTQLTRAIVEAASARGARTAVITANIEAPVAKVADHVVHLHAPVTFTNENRPTRQPPGTLFEQAVLAQCDAMILMLMQRRGTTEEYMRQRHTKFE